MTSDEHPQMTPHEATTPDLALCYALQTHLCYSYITPDALPFRVLRERLAVTGFEVHRAAPPAPESPEPRIDVERLAAALVAEIPAIHRWLTVGWKETMDDEAKVLAARLAAEYAATPSATSEEES